MHGTLEEGQYVLVDKLTPHWDSATHAATSSSSTRSSAKACVPRAGHRDRRRGQHAVHQAGHRRAGRPASSCATATSASTASQLNEPYIHGEPTQPSTASQSAGRCPPARLFVMGDNRAQSADSRAFGPICENDVIGRASSATGRINTPRHPADADATPTSPRRSGAASPRPPVERELTRSRVEHPAVDRRARSRPARRRANHSASSRSAVSGESEPWTRLWPVSSARSPRMLPGAACAGRVAPLISRHTADWRWAPRRPAPRPAPR